MIKNKIQFAVLNGGKSSRFGENKLNYILNGKTILQQTIENIGDYSDFPVMIIGNKIKSSIPNVELHKDKRLGLGPLRGIYTALSISFTQYVFIIAGDMPFIQSNLVNFLISYIQSEKNLIIPIHRGFYEPLCAIYHISLIHHFETFLRKGRYKISDSLKYVDKIKISEELWRKYDPQGISFHNINTKYDLPQNDKTFFSWIHRKEIKSRKNVLY